MASDGDSRSCLKSRTAVIEVSHFIISPIVNMAPGLIEITQVFIAYFVNKATIYYHTLHKALKDKNS
jgi:hypothetical protein